MDMWVYRYEQTVGDARENSTIWNYPKSVENKIKIIWFQWDEKPMLEPLTSAELTFVSKFVNSQVHLV